MAAASCTAGSTHGCAATHAGTPCGGGAGSPRPTAHHLHGRTQAHTNRQLCRCPVSANHTADAPKCPQGMSPTPSAIKVDRKAGLLTHATALAHRTSTDPPQAHAGEHTAQPHAPGANSARQMEHSSPSSGWLPSHDCTASSPSSCSLAPAYAQDAGHARMGTSSFGLYLTKASAPSDPTTQSTAQAHMARTRMQAAAHES